MRGASPLSTCFERACNTLRMDGPYAQAKSLLWQDLTSERLEQIRSPHPKKGLSGRDLLAQFTGLSSAKSNPKQAIVLDLYVNTLKFGEVCRSRCGSCAADAASMKWDAADATRNSPA